MPVIVPFFQKTGIGMRGVYILQSTFAVTVFILEIPSGYISDMLGRKKTLLVSQFLKGIGFLIFPFADGLAALILAEIILGIAVSLFSGTDTAIIYDSMKASGSKKAEVKVLGKSLAYSSFGEGLASLLASGLLFFSFGLRDIAYISALLAWIPFFIVLGIEEPPRNKMESKKHRENFSYIGRQMFKQSRLLNLIILNSVFSFSATLFAVWVFQKYWQNLSIPLVYFGILWGLNNFVVSLASRFAHKVEKVAGSEFAIVSIGLLPIGGYLGISFIDHFFGVVVCYLFQISRGIGQVILKDALNKRVSGDFRATANSIVSMGVRIFFTLGGPLFGWLVDTRGLTVSALGMAIFYSLVFLLVVVPLLMQRRDFIRITK